MSRYLTSIALSFSLCFASLAYAEETVQKATPSPNLSANHTVSALSLQDGQNAFNAGNYNQAFAHWQTLATQGHSDAQVFVGLSYANGWGVDRSKKLASHWYEKAALRENASAQFLLGLQLISGKEADLSKGVMWLRRAAENGDESARLFMKKAESRGWFKNVPVIEPENSQDKSPETVALADKI